VYTETEIDYRKPCIQQVGKNKRGKNNVSYFLAYGYRKGTKD